MSEPTCPSRGPRIGNKGRPVCALTLGHDGAHLSDPNTGFNERWHDPHSSAPAPAPTVTVSAADLRSGSHPSVIGAVDWAEEPWGGLRLTLDQAALLSNALGAVLRPDRYGAPTDDETDVLEQVRERVQVVHAALCDALDRADTGPTT